MSEVEFDLIKELKELGYAERDISSISSSDVLVFPDQRTRNRERGSNFAYVTHEMTDIAKMLKVQVKTELITRRQYPQRYLELKSADVVLPLLVVLKPVAIAAIQAVVSKLISRLLDSDKKKKKESFNVDFHVTKKTGDKWIKIDYNGPADKLDLVLKSLDG